VAQLERLREKNNELELNVKLDTEEHSKELKSLEDKLEEIMNSKDLLSKQNKQLDSQKNSMLKETEQRYLERNHQLEDECEVLKKKHNQEIADIQAKSEESLAQLKNFYEVERDRLDRRIIEEKDKFDKRY